MRLGNTALSQQGMPSWREKNPQERLQIEKQRDVFESGLRENEPVMIFIE